MRFFVQVNLEQQAHAVSRTLSLPGELCLDQLAEVLIASFEWRQPHLWRLRIAGREFGPGTRPAGDEAHLCGIVPHNLMRLSALGLHPGSAFTWLWDLDSEWLHPLRVTRVLDDRTLDIECIEAVGAEMAGASSLSCPQINEALAVILPRIADELVKRRRAIEFVERQLSS